MRHLSLSEVSILLVNTLALGLILHPLQFAFVQFLEGYWGPSRLARGLAARRVQQHRREFTAMRQRQYQLQKMLRTEGRGRLNAQVGQALVPAIIEADALSAALDRFPPEQRRFMPTRLGNMLRRHEDHAGKQYWLEAPTIAPHLVFHAPREHVAFVEDARELLDLSVRICTLGVLATLLTFIVLFPRGAWLLVALAPYVVAYIAYRGTIVAADQYGRTLATLIDLDRFALYDQLRLPALGTLADERARNARLMKLLRGEPVDGSFAYATPEPAPHLTITAVPTSDASAVIAPSAPPDDAGATT
jgi:hypothetical protein